MYGATVTYNVTGEDSPWSGGFIDVPQFNIPNAKLKSVDFNTLVTRSLIVAISNNTEVAQSGWLTVTDYIEGRVDRFTFGEPRTFETEFIVYECCLQETFQTFHAKLPWQFKANSGLAPFIGSNNVELADFRYWGLLEHEVILDDPNGDVSIFEEDRLAEIQGTITYTYAPIPEPSTVSLTGIGILVALGLARKLKSLFHPRFESGSLRSRSLRWSGTSHSSHGPRPRRQDLGRSTILSGTSQAATFDLKDSVVTDGCSTLVGVGLANATYWPLHASLWDSERHDPMRCVA